MAEHDCEDMNESKGDNSNKNLKDMSPEEVLFDIPCFICKHLERCGIGQERTPMECKCLSDWMKKHIEKD